MPSHQHPCMPPYGGQSPAFNPFNSYNMHNQNCNNSPMHQPWCHPYGGAYGPNMHDCYNQQGNANYDCLAQHMQGMKVPSDDVLLSIEKFDPLRNMDESCSSSEETERRRPF